MTAHQSYINNSGTSSFPFTINDLSALVAGNTAAYPPVSYRAVGPVSNPYSGTYYRAYEVAALQWLYSNSNTTNPSPPAADYIQYSQMLGGTADSTAVRSANTLTYAGMGDLPVQYIYPNVCKLVTTLWFISVNALFRSFPTECHVLID